MKQGLKDLGLAVLLGMVLPGLLLHLAVKYGKAPQQMTEETTVRETMPESGGKQIPVLFAGGKIEEMELNDYLTGVLLAEMPASFEMEALKAQAVVARTYTVRSELKGKHDEAVVCADSTCCQGYCTPDEYIMDGGTQENVEKMRQAVTQTDEQVLVYNGELIEATYFSCSGGMTEDAVAVWGTEVPYLLAVRSPGEEEATHYEDLQVFSREEVCSRLGIDPELATGTLFGKMTFTVGGGVETATVCGKEFSGTELRKLLNLYSTAFTVDQSGETVTFHTRGYGHRVGMSQYGADAMALDGSDYQQILAYYYQGTELQKLSD